MKNKYIDALFPNNCELIKVCDDDDPDMYYYEATIVDRELDPIRVRFVNDDCINIDCGELKYMKLSIEDLKQMIKLIKESTLLYEKDEKDEN